MFNPNVLCEVGDLFEPQKEVFRAEPQEVASRERVPVKVSVVFCDGPNDLVLILHFETRIPAVKQGAADETHGGATDSSEP
jgi:hypothetical protein